MKQKVMLSILGRQSYDGAEPDTIQLTTEGTMEFHNGGWDIRYEETELTGMAGVTTTFRVEPGQVILTRSGALRSQMIFQLGQSHESLYDMGFGALLMRIHTEHLFFDITPDYGVIDLVYGIDIEHSAAGVVDYHLEIEALDN